MAKALIMSVRVLGLLAIILGGLSWLTAEKHYLAPHIGIGFCVAIALLVMSVIAMARGAVVVGVIGLLVAILLPLIGFMQLPIAVRSTMGAIQVLHLALALMAIGIAERLYSAIRP